MKARVEGIRDDLKTGRYKMLADDILALHRPDKEKTAHRTKSYNPDVVTAFFAEHGIPKPEFEYQFHSTRKWRFDLAFLNFYRPLAIEVDGGIWIQGGHNRGAQMKKTWEKENEAACMGWRILVVGYFDLA